MPKTLEVLETQGVAVIGYGTDDLAAFFAARSSDNNKINRAPLRYDDAAGVAGWLAKNAELGLASGAVLAVPNPAPMDGDAIDGAIAAALEAAAARGVSGKDATPFLLAKLEEVTGGASLEANVALVLNNARVVVADANGDAATYAALLDALTDDQALWLEPTSAAKAGAAFAALLPRVAVVTPAERELDPLLAALGADVAGGVGERALRLAEAMREAAGDAGDRAVLVTRGDRGALLAVAGDDVVTSFPAPKPPRVVSSNGAGDALCGVAAAAVARGADLRSAARAGLAAAALTLGVPGSAPPGVDGAWLDGILSGK